ncbi:stage V sporulation protein S [Sulfobacillus harzensis]|uniref:Stage V sporulation protein S n=1 Tax=Sulfobacillus harzensis TaxID=2729629 RepID=A0A7Y0Q328_9FIRM|nr:stage V sporulation protein S [Sulfobacillus harzensis]NMP22970.1 stage V sporulation protein S [Sulfobacillus harzensis]
MQSLRVSAASRPKGVAGAIVAVIKESGPLELQAVGAGAVNQAVKAIAIARAFLTEEDLDLAVRPEFVELFIDGQTRTGIRLLVELISR